MPQPIPYDKRLALVCTSTPSTTSRPVNTKTGTFTNIFPTLVASGCTLNVIQTSGGGAYISSKVSVFSSGKDYAVGDVLKVSGSLLGGLTGTNDLNITVATINASGGVTGVTITGTSVDGSLAFYNVPVTGIANNLILTVTNNQGVYSLTETGTSTDYVIGTKLFVPGNVLGGVSPGNDLTFSMGAASGDPFLPKNISQNAPKDYSVVKFTLPTSYGDVVYMDWVTTTGLVDSCFMHFGTTNANVSSGLTTGNKPYWKFITNNTLNNVPDHLTVRQWSPSISISSEVVVTLFKADGTPLIQTTPWTIELIIYSLSS